MKITVAICTWNRAGLLDETLKSFAGLEIPTDVSWELVVVDNNSTDSTGAVLDAHRARLPIVKLFEPRPGKSFAANRALDHTTSDLLIWTDDDVRVSPGWLRAYSEAATSQVEAAYFAGPIDPWFESPPPAWIAERIHSLTGVYVIVDYGPDHRLLEARDPIFGANMAFRTTVARRFPFNESLGRIRGALFGADDTELIGRVRGAGLTGVSVPGARLTHWNPTSRLTAAYIQRWYRDSGRTLVRQGSIGGGHGLGAVPAWVIRRYVEEQAQRFFWAATAGDRWFEAFKSAARFQGVIQELRAANAARREP